MKTILLAGLFFLTAVQLKSFGQARSKEITGKVISFEESFPLKDVTVQGKPSGASATTGSNGVFKLALSESDKTIVISLRGYESIEIKITEAAEYDVVLKKSN